MSTTSKAVIRVAKIIAKRDEMDLEEAIQLVEETLQEISDNGYSTFMSEEIWQDNTGLEPDYLLECIL